MRRRMVSACLAVALLCSLLCFASCKEGLQKFTAQSFACFDTVSTVTGYATSREEFDRVSGEIFSSLEEYHRLYQIYESYEGVVNLHAVNALEDGIHPTLQVDARILQLLQFSKEAYDLTHGRVNVAMGSVLRLWHEARERAQLNPEEASLPSMEALQAAAAHTDIDQLLLDPAAGTVRLLDPGMTLDVGAIAKGYAVEQVARALEEQGITGYLINAGGNIRTVGVKGNGEAWTVGIEDPTGASKDGCLAYLSLAGESLVTSGSYQRFYTVEGKNYHHVIDPTTRMPAAYFTSVSVVCKSSALADALSTALFCMSLEEGMALVDSLEGVEALWVLTDGSQRASHGFAQYLKAA